MSAADNAGACGVLQAGSGEDSDAEPDAREDVKECSGDESDDVLVVSVDELEGCVVDIGSSGCDRVSVGEVAQREQRDLRTFHGGQHNKYGSPFMTLLTEKLTLYIVYLLYCYCINKVFMV